MITSDFDLLGSLKCDVCVVGTGPVGRSLAVDLHSRGLSVCMLESGRSKPDQKMQSLSDALIVSPQLHHRMDLAVSRSLGGTSRLWGGRCVFLDEIDFEQRDSGPDSGWPIGFHALRPYLQRAAELLGCDDGSFTAHDWAPGGGSEIDFTNVERWVNRTRIFDQLPDAVFDEIKILLNATVVDLDITPDSQSISGLVVERDGRKAVFRGATHYVLALGGIETARLLLSVQGKHPRLFGGETGPLGRNYMGHLSGSIASIRLFDPSTAHYFANLEGEKSFARRRMRLSSASQREHRLPNISFWPENAAYADERHGSGIFSLVFLVLKLPGVGQRFVADAIRQMQMNGSANYWAHLSNVVRDMHGTFAGAAEISRQYFLYRRRLPRLFVTNPEGVYPLRFHAEQMPSAQNGLRLSSDRDWLGLPRVRIEFSFSAEEMRRVGEAHKILDRALRRSGVGELLYNDRGDGPQPSEFDKEVAADGLHQIGLTRMAATPSAGVVDVNCRLFDFENLFVAGSSIFPTSGQASPTLPAVALAVRLSEHLAKLHAKPIACRQGLRILFVTASYYPAVRYGGPTYTVHSLARSLAARGNHVTVYTTDVDGDRRIEIPPGGMRILDGVEVHYFRSAINKIYFSPDMIRALKGNISSFDIVHAHGAFLYPTAAARRAARSAGRPFVFSPRGMLVYSMIKRKNLLGKAAWLLLFDRRNCRAASLIHATSELESRELKLLDLNPERIEVIPNGVDVSAQAQATSSESLAQARAKAAKPYVLFLGRVSWIKGIDRLIRAMSLVPSARLVIVGNDDENYTPELKRLASECGLKDRVSFAGAAYGDDKLAWFRAADLFVLPSYSESFGVVVIESLACGCPVIMTPEVGIAEDIRQTGAGIVVEGLPEKLAQAINTLLGEPKRRKQMGDIGREVARESYSWPRIGAAMESAYRRCIEGAHPASSA